MAAVVTAAAILTGCSHNEDEEPAGSSPLLISANASETRAGTLLGDIYVDFGVWAWKTGSDNALSLVLGRTTSAVEGSEYYTRLTTGGEWTYEYTDATATQYLRYWDRAATNYYFSAYAPYKAEGVALNSSHHITASPAGVSISGVSGNIPETEGIDWLEARWKRQILPTLIDIDLISDANHITANLTDIVPLTFHHILAATEFRVYAEEGSNITLQSIAISTDAADAIYTEADYAAGTWNHIQDSAATGLVNRTEELDLSGTSKENYISLGTLLQIPQNVTDRTIRINAVIGGGATRSGSFMLEEGWSGAKKYIYYLCIKNDEIILIDVVAEPWIAGEDIIIADDVVNW